MAFFQSGTVWVNQLGEGVAALYLDAPAARVNVVSRQLLADLDAALDAVAGAEGFRLLVVRSARDDSFLAGADVRELAAVRTPVEAVELSARGQEVFGKLAGLPIPSVAVISGVCLGGGLELALACDYRVAVQAPSTLLGLPEIELGLIPAWGGTQRLPRVVGLQRALGIILGRKRLRPAEALEWGLVDDVVPAAGGPRPGFLDSPAKRARTGLPLRSLADRALEGTALGRWMTFRATDRVLRRRTPDDMPAPSEALAAVRAGLRGGLDAGLAAEREAAGRLAGSPACRHLTELFLRREEARRLPERGPDDEPPVRRVGVLGFGVAGAGVAHLAALRGCEVAIQEEDREAMGVGMLYLDGLLEAAARKGQITREEKARLLSTAVQPSTSWKGFADLDLVIDVGGDDARRPAAFRDLEGHVSKSTVVTTQAASVCVRDLQRGLRHPARVAGFHLLPPVAKAPLVEVVRTDATAPAVVRSLQEFAVRLGKVPVVVRDGPGFLVHRVLAPYLNEAVTLVGEGVPVETVDRAMERFGMTTGPLELLDHMGLDAAARLVAHVRPALGERLAPHLGFARMRDRGWLGVRKKAGFYLWRRGRRRPHHAAQALLRRESAALGYPPLTPRDPDGLAELTRDRLVLLTVNEAFACLDEKIVADPRRLDLGVVLGLGWAPHRGGPVAYAEQRGLRGVADALSRLAARHGPRFEPHPRLLQLTSS